MRNLPLLIAGAFVLVAAPASAAVHITMTGVVVSGSDNGYLAPDNGAPFGSDPFAVDFSTGQLFGTPAGKAFTLVVTIDPTRGVREDSASSRVLYGQDAASPASAAFTLNGLTYDFGNFDATSAFSGLEKYDDFRSRNQPTAVDGLVGYLTSSQARPSMDGPYTIRSGSLDFSVFLPAPTFQTVDFSEVIPLTDISQSRTGRLSLSLRHTIGSSSFVVTGPERTANLSLRFDTLKATVDPPTPAPVPEPSTWAMMILGFGVVGGVLRRRPYLQT
jgi:hypothetical protein